MFIKKRLKMPKERLRKEEIKEGRAEEGNNEAGREGWKEKQVLSYCDGVCLCSSQAVECHPCPRSLHPDTWNTHLTMADITIVLKSETEKAPSSHVKLNIRLG